MGIKSIAFVASTLILSSSVNAAIFRTLNGIDYEWLDLKATQGISRDAVELRLTDNADDLHGFEYASRQLFEDLLLSYSTWDGISGNHSAELVLDGMRAFNNDFRNTTSQIFVDVNTTSVDEGKSIFSDSQLSAYGFFGSQGECGSGVTCFSRTLNLLFEGRSVTVQQVDVYGWDSTFDVTASSNSTISSSLARADFGSFLFREVGSSTVVPIPAAVWLFGSGLLGLIGLARRKA